MDPPRSSTPVGSPTAPSHPTKTLSLDSLLQKDAESERPSVTSPAATAAAALSQDRPSIPYTIVSSTKKRKAHHVPGSRGVATLTAQQLAKKRANDREAQRAIRERTRNTIQTLERRIHDLEGQQPFQELQRVIQERDRAIAECEEFRRRLGTIADVAGRVQQQQQAQPSLSELATVTAQQSRLPPLTHPSSQHQPQGEGYGTPQAISYPHQQLQSALHSPTSTVHKRSSVPISAANSAHPPEDGNFRRWPVGPEHPSAPSHPPPRADGSPYNSRHAVAAAAPPAHHGHTERLELNFVLDTSHKQSTRSNPPSSGSPFSPHTLRESVPPVHARTTLLSPPSCPLDSLLIDFHTNRRKMLHDGASPADAIGPPYPSFQPMVDPDATHQRNCHPLSALMLEILYKFPDINQRPEQVAVYFIMFLIMRWTICPCEDCYQRLPDWCRPTAEQYERSHVAWVDYLPWPSMRSHVCCNPIRFEDFFVPYSTTLSLNWHFPHDLILLSFSSGGPHGPEVMMNPVFEHHLRDLRNWSLGPKFRDAFPQLANHTVNIRERG